MTNSFAYDLNGNLLSDGLRHFEYDNENQLAAVTVSNAWRSEFTYDALRRRRETADYAWSTSAWVQTNEVRYVYDRLLVAQERDGSGMALVAYTRGRDLSSSSMQGAGGIGGLLARTDLASFRASSSAAHAFYHANGNGNITAMESTAGVLVALYAYLDLLNELMNSDLPQNDAMDTAPGMDEPTDPNNPDNPQFYGCAAP